LLRCNGLRRFSVFSLHKLCVNTVDIALLCNIITKAKTVMDFKSRIGFFNKGRFNVSRDSDSERATSKTINPAGGFRIGLSQQMRQLQKASDKA
jgi:hypothetical protein